MFANCRPIAQIKETIGEALNTLTLFQNLIEICKKHHFQLQTFLYRRYKCVFVYMKFIRVYDKIIGGIQLSILYITHTMAS